MTRPDDALTHFDHWLDACIAGESTPGDAASPSDSDASLRATARQLHYLAAPPGASDDPGTTRRLDAIWETITMQAPTPAPVFGPARPVPVNNREVLRPPLWQRPRLAAGVNLFLAAVLLLGLGFGAWRTWAVIEGGGGNDDPPPTELAALFQPEATPEGTPRPFQNNYGTPIPVPEGMTLPSADECTIEPITVDEIMTTVELGFPMVGYEGNEDLTGSGIPTTGTWPQGTPPGETVTIVADIHREWTACVISGSWMQVLAFMHDTWIRDQLPRLIFPIFTSREEARQILETMAATGITPAGQTPHDVFGAYSLIDPDPSQSYLEWPIVWPGTIRFNGEDESAVPSMAFGVRDNDETRIANLHYIWDPLEQRWDLFANPYPQG